MANIDERRRRRILYYKVPCLRGENEIREKGKEEAKE